MISSPGCVCIGATYRIEVNAYLHDLASGCAEVVPLQVGAFGSRLLSPRHVRSKAASGDQHRERHDHSLSHVEERSCFMRHPLGTGSAPSPGWTLHYRSDLNAARSSDANSSGCSQAAKWPPLSTSRK